VSLRHTIRLPRLRDWRILFCAQLIILHSVCPPSVMRKILEYYALCSNQNTPIGVIDRLEYYALGSKQNTPIGVMDRLEYYALGSKQTTPIGVMDQLEYYALGSKQNTPIGLSRLRTVVLVGLHRIGHDNALLADWSCTTSSPRRDRPQRNSYRLARALISDFEWLCSLCCIESVLTMRC
jgi:hypothetical protein